MNYKSIVLVAASLTIVATGPAFARHHHHHKHHKSMTSGGMSGGGMSESPPKAGNAGSQGEANGTSTPAGPANK